MASVCSIDGCKRAVTCLCRHCQQDVCSKHFNEHQIQVNNELIPITDRLNELKMKLQINDQTIPLVILQTWRERKYDDIDKEYNYKVQEFKNKVSKYDEEISRIISNIKELIDEGDVSIDQIKEIQTIIENMTNQINNLMNSQPIETINKSNLIGTYIRMGGIQYLVKARIKCSNTDLYALESEKALAGYDGLCPKCNTAHVFFEKNRGFYTLCEALNNAFLIKNKK